MRNYLLRHYLEIPRNTGEGSGAGGGSAPGGAAPGASTAPGAAAGMLGGGDQGQPPAGTPPPGAPAPKWWESMQPGPVRDLMATKNYGSPDELANAYWNANKMLNGAGDVISVPGKDAPPEEWSKFWGKLGKPEKPDGYTEHMKLDGIQHVNEDLLTFSKDFFHQLDLPASKAQKALELWEGFAKKQNEAAETALKAANEAEVGALKTELGGKFDEAIENGKRAVRALGLPDAELAKIEAAVGTSSVLRLMASLGQRIREGSLSSTQGGAPNAALATPAAAQAEINRLRGDAEFIRQYEDGNHPQHAEAMKRMEALYARAAQSS